MGLSGSLEQFLLNTKASSAAFGAYESIGLDDTVEFSRQLKRAEERKLITVDRRDPECFYVYKEGKDMQNGKALNALEATDERSKAVQKTPWRVSLEAMKQRVDKVEFIYPDMLPTMTICVIKLDNGYVLVGESAPADPDNFDRALGQEYAYENAMKKLWPLEAYVMRDHMSGLVEVKDPAARWPA